MPRALRQWNKESLVGQKFARLTVVEPRGSDKHNKQTWLCRCNCGGEIVTATSCLRGGNTTSCGCFKREATSKRHRTHGESRGPEYNSWIAMKARCYDKKHKNYAIYGGRGIRVCKRWLHSYENFLKDMGRRPFPRWTVDRKNTNGDYTPKNCRWASHTEQVRNSRHCHMITWQGETHPMSVWEERLGFTRGTIYTRLKLGWPLERIMTTPTSLVRNHDRPE